MVPRGVPGSVSITFPVGSSETEFGFGPRQTEIGNLDPALARDQNVARLRVAVDDARGMRGGQAVARLHGDVELLRGVSAGAEGRDNFIGTETCAGGEGHGVSI